MLDWRSLPYGPERYHAYLASRDWKLKSRATIRRAHGVCENCQAHDATEVHHLTYIRLYNERLDDLFAVCHQCHLWLSALTDDRWERAVVRTPDDAACLRCGAIVSDPVGRNAHGEWFCEPCAVTLDDARRVDAEE